MPKRRILVVDDDLTILLTMRAVLELNGYEVETAASAREARSLIRTHEFQMVISDMRMEEEASGREVLMAARTAAYHPAVALLTAFPEDDAEEYADHMFIKAMQTAELLSQIEALMNRHAEKLARLATAAAPKSKKEKKAEKKADKKSAKQAAAKAEKAAKPAKKPKAAKPAKVKPAKDKKAAKTSKKAASKQAKK